MMSTVRTVAGSRRTWAVVVFVGCLAIYLATYPRHIINADALSASVQSYQIATTGTPWLDHFDWTSVVHIIPGYNADISPWVNPGAGGHLVSYRSPGATLVSIPAYWVNAHVLGHHGYTFGPGNVTACVLTATALTLFFLTLVRRVRISVAVVATLVLAFATPMWSVSAAFLWTHPITVLGIAGMAWAADRERWWLVGLFGGVAVWGRLHTVVIVAILGLGVSITRRQLAPMLRAGVASLVMLILASGYSHWLYGTWSPAGGYGNDPAQHLANGSTGNSPTIGSGALAKLMNQVALWVAPDRGILVFTPLLLILVPLVIKHWRDLPDWSRMLLLGGVAYAVVQGQINGFTGGSGFFGYRLMLEPLMCAAPACVYAAVRMPRWLHLPAAFTVAAMCGSFTYAALTERNSVGLRDVPINPVPYLPLHSAWRGNSVIADLRSQGPDLWLCLIVAIVIAYYVTVFWRSRSTAPGAEGDEPSIVPTAPLAP